MLAILDIVCAVAVAEALEVVEPKLLQHAQHDAGQRRLVGRLEVHPASDRSTRAARHEERHPLVVVQIGVAHRRSVDQERVVQQGAVAVRRVPQLFQDVRHQADVKGVELREVQDLLFFPAMVRSLVEGALEPALRIAAVRGVAPQLEGEHPRHVGGERQHLQVEHQLDVLAEGVRDPGRRGRQFAQLAGAVARFHDLDAPLDLAHVVEIVGEPRAIRGPQLFLEPPG